jgi:hypothetical protein
MPGTVRGGRIRSISPAAMLQAAPRPGITIGCSGLRERSDDREREVIEQDLRGYSTPTVATSAGVGP